MTLSIPTATNMKSLEKQLEGGLNEKNVIGMDANLKGKIYEFPALLFDEGKIGKLTVEVEYIKEKNDFAKKEIVIAAKVNVNGREIAYIDFKNLGNSTYLTRVSIPNELNEQNATRVNNIKLLQDDKPIGTTVVAKGKELVRGI